MHSSGPTKAQQIARAASDFELRSTGMLPRSITVVLSEETVVITLRGTLSRAEAALAKSPEGAAQLREFHQRLFGVSSQSLQQEIRGITGVDVLDATAEIETVSGTVVEVFTLAQAVPTDTWSGSDPGPAATDKE